MTDLDRPLTLIERLMISDDADCREAADALEAQAARVKELEKDFAQKSETANILLSSCHLLESRIATLEAQLEAFRVAVCRVKTTSTQRYSGHWVTKEVFGALMSALRNTETKDDE